MANFAPPLIRPWAAGLISAVQPLKACGRPCTRSSAHAGLPGMMVVMRTFTVPPNQREHLILPSSMVHTDGSSRVRPVPCICVGVCYLSRREKKIL
jgi:hypothetical protein